MSRVGRPLAGLLTVLVAIAACDPDRQTDILPMSPSVVIYTDIGEKDFLADLLGDYTQQTGVAVTVRYGDARDIVDDVIANQVTPPADLLWTGSVTGVWRAAEEGAIRPLSSTGIRDRVPDWLRDPDGFWIALAYHTAVFVYDPDRIDPSLLSGYASLANAAFEGAICLSSPDRPINRAVLAMMIDDMGARAAEIAVRGWISNLASTVYQEEAQMLQAVERGDCSIGIASSGAAAAAATKLHIHVPATPYIDIAATGVGRHARHPAAANALLEWLTQESVQMRIESELHFSAATQVGGTAEILKPLDSRPGPKHVVRVALRADDAEQLAERARYR